MGIEKDTFVGPVIKCKNPTKTSNRQGRRCSNDNCKNHRKENMGGAFCPKCGGKIEDYPIPTTMSTYQILDEEGIDCDQFFVIHDEWHEMGKGLYFITDNRKEYAKPNSSLTPEKITTSLEIFNAKFEQEIRALKKYYSVVEVDFIILTYYS